jgi:hypothetical protein
LLLKLIDGKVHGKPKRIILQAELVRRTSTARQDEKVLPKPSPRAVADRVKGKAVEEVICPVDNP